MSIYYNYAPDGGKLDMRYAAYFPEYTQYFGRASKLLNSMYGMTNSGKLFADELTEW